MEMGKHFSLSVITSKMFLLLGKRRTLSACVHVVSGVDFEQVQVRALQEIILNF